jgi:hypothetical protein
MKAHIRWFNDLPKLKKEELALSYYGTIILWDDEIECIWNKEVPQERLYTESEVKDILRKYIQNERLQYKQKQGDYSIDELLKELNK